jgi:hypothetical protein
MVMAGADGVATVGCVVWTVKWYVAGVGSTGPAGELDRASNV